MQSPPLTFAFQCLSAFLWNHRRGTRVAHARNGGGGGARRHPGLAWVCVGVCVYVVCVCLCLCVARHHPGSMGGGGAPVSARLLRRPRPPPRPGLRSRRRQCCAAQPRPVSVGWWVSHWVPTPANASQRQPNAHQTPTNVGFASISCQAAGGGRRATIGTAHRVGDVGYSNLKPPENPNAKPKTGFGSGCA